MYTEYRYLECHVPIVIIWAAKGVDIRGGIGIQTLTTIKKFQLVWYIQIFSPGSPFAPITNNWGSNPLFNKDKQPQKKLPVPTYASVICGPHILIIGNRSIFYILRIWLLEFFMGVTICLVLHYCKINYTLADTVWSNFNAFIKQIPKM